MNIGILTFYKVANFGANIQAVSTFYFLKKQGHNPIFLNYISEFSENKLAADCENSIQARTHIDFVDKYIKNQTRNLYTTEDVNAAISDYEIDAIIIGSDAVAQHHPLLSRIHKGRRKPFYIERIAPERLFPNPFWGIGFSRNIPTVMMSVSSQNSKYCQFSKKTKSQMLDALSNMKYISVRDSWTKEMMKAIGITREIIVTPDPVFAFNFNAGELIPSEDNIRSRFSLPKHYILVSLHSQSLSEQCLSAIKYSFADLGKECVALPMPGGIKYKHCFDYTIEVPLSPIDWYALIKYSSGYIGSNMHPIIVSLHNSVPCYSIDHWGTKDFFNRQVNDGSSKVEHIMGVFGLKHNVKPIVNGTCNVNVPDIIKSIESFPRDNVYKIAMKMHRDYEIMMKNILNRLES